MPVDSVPLVQLLSPDAYAALAARVVALRFRPRLSTFVDTMARRVSTHPDAGTRRP